jgi:hypothetical protein
MKNNIFIAILSLITTQVIGQTSLEKAVLTELNLYRKTHNLQPVFHSTDIAKASKHHTRWMVATNLCSHYETTDVVGFKTLYSPEDRGTFYGLFKNINGWEEICSHTKAVEGNFITPTIKRDAVLGKDIIIKFSKSPPHNESLLTPGNEGSEIRVGISVIIKGAVAYTTIFFLE